MKMMINLKNIWKSQASSFLSLTSRELIELSNGIRCFVGRIGATNAKMFQIEVDTEVSFDSSYYKRFYGVEIRSLQGHESEKRYITIILSDNDLLEVFILFIEDLIDVLDSTKSHTEVPTLLSRRIEYWARLFSKIKGDLLLPHIQRGLFGELVILKRALVNNDPLDIVMSWIGPEGNQQDFFKNDCAIEVKASKATTPEINITSEAQLDNSPFKSLFLAVVQISEVGDQRESLGFMIESIKALLKTSIEAHRLFVEKLSRIGIKDGEEENYKELGFKLRSIGFYQVIDGFPCITKASISSDAINNVKYKIDYSSIQSFEVEESMVLNDFLNK